jgi:hypothetical protein
LPGCALAAFAARWMGGTEVKPVFEKKGTCGQAMQEVVA